MVEADPIVIPIEVETTEREEIQNAIKELKLLKKEVEDAKKKKEKTSKKGTKTEKKGKKDSVSEKIKELKKDQKEIKGELSEKFGKIDEIFGIITGKGVPSFIVKIVPFLGVALLAAGFVRQMLDELIKEMFKNGGPFDRRLKIFISKQFLTLTKREDAKKLSEGYGTLRVTSTQSLRGPTTQIYNPQQAAKKGNPIFNDDLDGLSKNASF